MTDFTSSVAVIIAAYNASATVGRAVASALAESEAAQVVVVDDDSTDDTREAARKADDGSGRLRIVRQVFNEGPAAARNRAIRETDAPWIAVLDADDYFLPGRLKDLLRHADSADFIADDFYRTPDGNPVLGVKEPRRVGFEEFVCANITDPKRQRQEMGFLKPLMRRDFLMSHNIAYKENMRLGEDYELYARSLASGARMMLVPAQGYVSVWRETSLSGDHRAFDLEQLRDCDRSLAAMPGLSAADRDALRRHFLSVDCRLQWRNLIDAVKARSPSRMLACFARPWPVPGYLFARLAEQAVARSGKALQRLKVKHEVE
ncbi:MAG: glycosyltransferase family 2 protein [Alphaproteobacteria bacterium]|nr:glycosyltransferase family 2 protein [Alphaproteobacteria bacterium]